MPFINERLEENKNVIAREKYAKTIARTSRFRFDPVQIIEKLQARIIGQDHVINNIEDMLFSVKADFATPERPLCILFFLGPTGVGKTEIVRVLAETILGSADKLCRIDMNTLAQEHYSAAITGSPPGYVGSKEGQTLFNIEKITGTFSEPGMVLFDEIEKADKSVVRALLNLFDTGKLTLSSGVKELDFRNTLIFMTSNIGVKELTEHINSYQSGWRYWLGCKPCNEEKILDKSLHNHFDPEFLNRIDQIIPFNRLDSERLDALISIEIEKLNKRLKRRQASVILQHEVRTYLCQEYDERFGARDLARRIRIELEPVLAKALINHPEEEAFFVMIENRKIVILPTKKGSED